MTNEGLVLSEAQANAWIKKAVFSSDGKKVGEVTALKCDATGKVAELQAGIGGFLGMGETQVRVMPSQFKLENDRVVLSLTAEEVKALPKIAHKRASRQTRQHAPEQAQFWSMYVSSQRSANSRVMFRIVTRRLSGSGPCVSTLRYCSP